MYKDIAEKIHHGALAVFPTDTVFGIGCDPWNESALHSLFQAKKRPAEKSIPVLVSSIEKARDIAVLSPEAENLIRMHWPGALTIIAKQKKPFPKSISQDDTIALRMPNHTEALALIEACGGALATTSANQSGNPPVQSLKEAQELFGEHVQYLVGTPPTKHVPSTIVDTTQNPPSLLRQGAVHITSPSFFASHKHLLTPSVRIASLFLAFLFIWGAWSNREFWSVFPFSLQTFIDGMSALWLLSIALFLPSLKKQSPFVLRAGISFVAFYFVSAQILSLWAYVRILGANYIATQYGSFYLFFAQTIALDIGIPLLFVGFLIYATQKITQEE